MNIIKHYLSDSICFKLYHLFPNKFDRLKHLQIYNIEELKKYEKCIHWQKYKYLFLKQIKHWDVNKFQHVQLLILSDFINEKIILPDNLKQIKFGYCFNQEKFDLPPTLKQIIFSDYFDQSIILPKILEKVKFGSIFDKFIFFPQSLKYIEFGIFFNQPVVLPINLKILKIGLGFQQNYIKFPEKLKMLIVPKLTDVKFKISKSTKLIEYQPKLY